ncbi:U2 snRNP complex subunit msl1 [Peltigera leucophlebia]|nr:U2 snRNP complex subunit msl1 [Peltigera leucophlebia]
MASKGLPSLNGPPQKLTGAPNQTLYCTNLPEKLQKPDLKLSLYTLFSTYGPVLDVVAVKTPKMRGQAHVVFRDIQASTQAMRALQDFDFFGKEMKIQYAKGKSDTIAKLDGTYKMPAVVATEVATTELQQSIFNLTASSSAAAPAAAAATAAGVVKTSDAGTTEIDVDKDGPHGMKRRREVESDDEGAPMEEGDSDAPMDASSDDESS